MRAQGLVVGILGPWGSGKTSFVNLVRHYLTSERVPVRDFNPWLFSGTEHLVQASSQSCLAISGSGETYAISARCSTSMANICPWPPVWAVGAGNSAVVVDVPRCGPMLSPRVPHHVPIPGPRMERETLVSAHDRIMGTHRVIHLLGGCRPAPLGRQAC